MAKNSLWSLGPPCSKIPHLPCRSTNSEGISLEKWASAEDLTLLFDPKQPHTFNSARWNTTSNPDLAFTKLEGALPQRLILDPFPKTHQRPEMSGLWNFSVRVQSWSDKIKSDPVLICKIFENHPSDPVLIRQGKIMYFYFASWGKRTTGAIWLLAKYDWLKAK